MGGGLELVIFFYYESKFKIKKIFFSEGGWVWGGGKEELEGWGC